MEKIFVYSFGPKKMSKNDDIEVESGEKEMRKGFNRWIECKKVRTDNMYNTL